GGQCRAQWALTHSREGCSVARRDADHTGRAGSSDRPQGPGRLAHWLPVALVLLLLGAGVAADRYAWGPTYLGWHETPTEPAAVEPPTGLALPDPPVPEPVAEPLEPGALDPAAVT